MNFPPGQKQTFFVGTTNQSQYGYLIWFNDYFKANTDSFIMDPERNQTLTKNQIRLDSNGLSVRSYINKNPHKKPGY